MRIALLTVLFVVSCTGQQSEHCNEAFCLSDEAVVVGHQQPADFDLFQIDWRGSRFGVYAGNHPDFKEEAAVTISVPFDQQAMLLIHEGNGEPLVKTENSWPEYLHLSGPCDSPSDCSLLEFSEAIRPIK